MAQNNDSKFYNGQIIEGKSIVHRFGKERAFEIQFIVGIFNDDNTPKTKVEVYLEVSMEYGKGNNASKTQWDMTKETLASLGFVGEDISNAQLNSQLVNKPCRIREQTLDRDGKPLNSPRYYFTSARQIQPIDNANEMLKSIMSGVAAGAGFGAPAAAAPTNPFNMPKPGAAQTTAPAAGAPNPFAGM